MPFKSEAQRAYMHVHHPKIAARWDKETPPGKLPKHVKDHPERASHTAAKRAVKALKGEHSMREHGKRGR